MALGVLAPLSILASDAPRGVAWIGACAACVAALHAFRRESGRRPQAMVIAGDGGVRIDGAQVDDFGVRWRGALAFVRWRDGRGRVHRRAFWPDTLPPALRRELRLAAPQGQGASDSPGVAH